MVWNYLSKYFGDPKYCKFKEFTSKSFYFVHSYGTDSIDNLDFCLTNSYFDHNIVAICVVSKK